MILDLKMPMQRKPISHRRVAALSSREHSSRSLTSAVGSLLGSLLGGSSGSSNGAGGSNGGSSSSTPASPSATASTSNSGGSSGGGNGNGGSGKASGSSGGNGNGNGNGGKGNSGGSAGSGGSSNGSSSVVGSGTSATPSVNAGESSGIPQPSAPSGSSVPGSPPSGSAASATGTTSFPGSAPGNSSSGQLTSPPSNVGASPSVNSSSSSSSGFYGSASPSQVGDLGSGGSSTTGITGLGATATPTIGIGAGATQNRLSSGAIAGVTVASLLFLLTLTLVLIRRRAVARRAQRFKRWLANNATSHSFSFVGVSSDSSHDSTGRSAGNRASARSSFATNFDHGLLFQLASPAQLGIPERPPMAEARDCNRVLISTGGEAARRESFASMASNGSNTNAQYLVAPTDYNNDTGTPSPMSVRPFSPSETFSFPKPPAPSSSPIVPARQGVGSPSASTATLVQLSPPPPVFHRELASPPSPIINTGAELLPVPTISVNPFEDPIPAFSGTETIRRPFTPNLEDELLVSMGDTVRILQVFDDGWALVERISVNTIAAGDSHGQQRRGLIPVDCFRETGQELPHFLAQKRLSDYATPHGIRAAF